METKLVFQNKCTACGQTRRKEDLAYDLIEFKPYCKFFEPCGDKRHPNSYDNYVMRGNKKVELVTFREAQELYKEELTAKMSPEELEILNLANKPTSIRIGSFELAQYIVMFKREKGLESVTAAIQQIVREHAEGMHVVPEPEAETEQPAGKIEVPTIKPMHEQSEEYQKSSIEAAYDDSEEEDMDVF